MTEKPGRSLIRKWVNLAIVVGVLGYSAYVFFKPVIEARAKKRAIRAGMTLDEVLDNYGENATRIAPVASGKPERWAYPFGLVIFAGNEKTEFRTPGEFRDALKSQMRESNEDWALYYRFYGIVGRAYLVIVFGPDARVKSVREPTSRGL